VIPIGPFARQSRLSVKQLRAYDALGLLALARVDGDSGYRYYHPAQARSAITIALLRSLAVPPEQIRDLLVADGPDAERLLEAHRARLTAELSRSERTIRALTHLRSDGGRRSARSSTRRRFPPGDAAGIFNLLWAIVVVLMIVRPGSTTGAWPRRSRAAGTQSRKLRKGAGSIPTHGMYDREN